MNRKKPGQRRTRRRTLGSSFLHLATVPLFSRLTPLQLMPTATSILPTKPRSRQPRRESAFNLFRGLACPPLPSFLIAQVKSKDPLSFCLLPPVHRVSFGHTSRHQTSASLEQLSLHQLSLMSHEPSVLLCLRRLGTLVPGNETLVLPMLS